MYLPQSIPNANVLITVKTYPLPSSKYRELVCTAGLLDGNKWIRIYPVAYRFLSNMRKYPKYGWIELNLVKNESDFRPESYRPKSGVDEEIKLISTIDTNNNWEERKKYIFNEVFTSMKELLDLAKSDSNKSLATLKPLEIIDFIIESDDREWKKKWQALSKQGSLFEIENVDSTQYKLFPIKKLPYKYSYKFTTLGDDKPRKLMIEDWEIGALFWNCMRITGGDEDAANKLVKEKYLNNFVANKELFFFVGTTQRFHNIALNPFVIIGVFYPSKETQTSIF